MNFLTKLFGKDSVRDQERAILGHLMKAPDSADLIWKTPLAPEDFLFKEHRELLEAAFSLYEKSWLSEKKTVAQRLPEKFQSLLKKLEPSGDFVKQVKAAKDRAVNRKISQFLRRQLRAVDKQGNTFAGFRARTMEGLLRCLNSNLPRELTIGHVSMDVFASLQAAASSGTRASYGPKDGAQPEDVMFVSGKLDAAMLDIAIEAANDQKSVAIFSVTHSKEELATRILQRVSGIKMDKLIFPRLMEQSDWLELQRAAGEMHEFRLALHDERLDWFELWSLFDRIRHQHGLNLVVVDYPLSH